MENVRIYQMIFFGIGAAGTINPRGNELPSQIARVIGVICLLCALIIEIYIWYKTKKKKK